MIGLTVLVIGILVLCHLPYIQDIKEVGFFEVVERTIEEIMASINNLKDVTGGGIIGAIFAGLFALLFDFNGTKIVAVVFIVCGTIMFTGITIFDIVQSIKEGAHKGLEELSKMGKREREKIEKARAVADKYEEVTTVPITNSHDEIEDVEEKEEPSDKIVITSLNDLTKIDSKEDIKAKDDIDIDVFDSEAEEGEYVLPPMNLLNKPKSSKVNQDKDVQETAKLLIAALNDFGVPGCHIVAAHIGPAVTQYELEIKSGTKLTAVTSLNKELALALAAKDIRIEAPIPGKRTIGIEVPNKEATSVCVREVLDRVPANMNGSKLLTVLGKDIMGEPKWMEINKTPHLLVAGSTGSGKSVCINSIIVSILMRSKPDEVKLVMVDPKKVELSMYNGVPHLLCPVVTNAKKANDTLKKIVQEMENRYDEFERTGTKNIAGYNDLVESKNNDGMPGEKMRKMPFIVVIIDELADLMLVAAKEVEDSIMRITQMARAAGIHLIVATQRPSTDVITGVVKANIPSRISFAVSSGIDSRTILDTVGAEKLLGKGDMLYLPQGENAPTRIQGTFITDNEIKAVVDYVCKQQKARYDARFEHAGEEDATTMVDGDVSADTQDPMYKQIVEFVVTSGKASASLLQRRFHIGYNRAASYIDLLEERGIIGPQNGSKPREVIYKLDSNVDEEE
ncbi:MAG: cell division protein FtsK [Bacilli bacterium]|nr:cell division protein FtsK [Bacilli bacterium]